MQICPHLTKKWGNFVPNLDPVSFHTLLRWLTAGEVKIPSTEQWAKKEAILNNLYKCATKKKMLSVSLFDTRNTKCPLKWT